MRIEGKKILSLDRKSFSIRVSNDGGFVVAMHGEKESFSILDVANGVEVGLVSCRGNDSAYIDNIYIIGERILVRYSARSGRPWFLYEKDGAEVGRLSHDGEELILREVGEKAILFEVWGVGLAVLDSDSDVLVRFPFGFQFAVRGVLGSKIMGEMEVEGCWRLHVGSGWGDKNGVRPESLRLYWPNEREDPGGVKGLVGEKIVVQGLREKDRWFVCDWDSSELMEIDFGDGVGVGDKMFGKVKSSTSSGRALAIYEFRGPDSRKYVAYDVEEMRVAWTSVLPMIDGNAAQVVFTNRYMIKGLGTTIFRKGDKYGKGEHQVRIIDLTSGAVVGSSEIQCLPEVWPFSDGFYSLSVDQDEVVCNRFLE